jgi:uncharacterized membrane protein (DUF485 family)
MAAGPRKLSTILSFVLLGLLALFYAGFMVAAAFAPGWFAGPVMAGGTVSVWFAYGLGLIWSVVLATGVYVAIANAEENAR